MRAYVICKERLDAVQATLDQYLQPKDRPTGLNAGPAAPRRSDRGEASPGGNGYTGLDVVGDWVFP
jgi:hypothetical protein